MYIVSTYYNEQTALTPVNLGCEVWLLISMECTQTAVKYDEEVDLLHCFLVRYSLLKL